MGDSKREFRRKTFNLPPPLPNLFSDFRIFRKFANERTNERAASEQNVRLIIYISRVPIQLFISSQSGLSITHFIFTTLKQYKDRCNPSNIHDFVSMKTTAFYRLRAKTGLLVWWRVAPPVHRLIEKERTISSKLTRRCGARIAMAVTTHRRDRFDTEASRVNLFRIRWDAFPRRLMAD